MVHVILFKVALLDVLAPEVRNLDPHIHQLRAYLADGHFRGSQVLASHDDVQRDEDV